MKILKLICSLFFIWSCNSTGQSEQSRIWVVQEYKLDSNQSFFWFKNEQDPMHDGISYFQICNNKCELSIKAANAYSEIPVQIAKFKNDTIFVLTYSDIISISANKDYSIVGQNFSHVLYDVAKRPNQKEMFFLDTACH